MKYRVIFMEISIDKNATKINDNIISKNKPQEIVNLFFENEKIVKLDDSINLHIFDRVGFRFWISNSVISEFQIFYKIEESKNVFPSNEFIGNLTILNFEITKHLTKDQLSKHFNVIQDSDDLKYGINSVIIKDLPQCKILFDINNYIERVSF